MKIFTMSRLLSVIMLFALLSSCGPSKKTHQERLYLKGIDTSKSLGINIPEPVVQKSDILSISVFSDNAEATAQFNQVQAQSASNSLGANSSSGGVTATAGYLVDVNGNIYFHDLGLIKVDGLTKIQLVDTLAKKLSVFLKNPYIEIRFLNARVTMLGEIARPGTINIPEQRISILDAIALSGDLTVYAKRDNILVIRERNGKRETGRLDIRNPAIYQSEYFYLQQNDLVYIEPIQKKPIGSDAVLVRNVALAASIVSTLAILYSIFRN